MKKDDKALFMHRLNTNYQLGKHMLPGGGIEQGEPPKQAGVREAAEELAIDIAITDLKLAHIMYRPPHDETGERVDFFFVTTLWDKEPIINEPHKCDELAWFSLNNLPESVPEYIRVAIAHWQHGVHYSEFGWDK